MKIWSDLCSLNSGVAWIFKLNLLKMMIAEAPTLLELMVLAA